MEIKNNTSLNNNIDNITHEILRGAIDKNDPDAEINGCLRDISKYMQAERVYILEQEDDKLYNTYEWVEEGVESQKEILQDIPINYVQDWYDYFKLNKTLVIHNEKELEVIAANYPVMYQHLKIHKINTIVAGPLIEQDQLVGLYCIDNPKIDNLEECSTMLEMLAFFAISIIRRRKVEYMTYTDQLTGFGNRYAYYRYLKNCPKDVRLGVVYCDVVGLKAVNDQHGHQAGDKLLITITECIKECFETYPIFRLGGDEFVIICPDIAEDNLQLRTARLKHSVLEKDTALSVGLSWHEEGTQKYTFDEVIKEAEEEMYKAKRYYYQFGFGSRPSMEDIIEEEIPSWDVDFEKSSHYMEKVHFCQYKDAYISKKQQREIDNLLVSNCGVGVIAGYFDDNYTIYFISDLALATLGYQYYYNFIRQTKNKMVTLFANNSEKAIFVNCINSDISGGWFVKLLNKQWTPVDVYMQGTISEDNNGNKIWMLSIRQVIHPFQTSDIDCKQLLNEFDDMGILVISEKDKRVLYFNDFVQKVNPKIEVGLLASKLWEHNLPIKDIIGENTESFIIKYNSVFGDIVAIDIKRIMWRDMLPAFLVRVVPCTEEKAEELKNKSKNAIEHIGTTSLYWSNKLFFDLADDSYKDNLTGGYTRLGFINRANYMFMHGSKLADYAVMYLNIKNFKAVNSIFNSEAGDNLLREFYNNIINSSLQPVLSSRKNSDHFIFLIEKSKLDFKQLASLLEYKWCYAYREMLINCACGIYLATEEDNDISLAIGRATLAKSYVNDVYVQPYAVFSDFMEEEYVQRAEIISAYENAIKHKEFEVYLQPVVDIKTGKVVSAESLIRWNHPDKGMILPGVFVPVLEEYGFITKLDYYVMNCIYNYQRKRHQEGKPLIPISINLSRMDFHDAWLMEEIKNKAEMSNLPQNTIRYEITETAYNSIEDHKNDFLDVVHKHGIKVLLDDFGSGYSSFGMIQNFDFDILKLDIAFIRQLENNPKVRSIINTIIHMCHELNIEVVAEGVENKEEIDFLKLNDCDYVQGYYYSKPLTFEQFDKFIEIHI